MCTVKIPKNSSCWNVRNKKWILQDWCIQGQHIRDCLFVSYTLENPGKNNFKLLILLETKTEIPKENCNEGFAWFSWRKLQNYCWIIKEDVSAPYTIPLLGWNKYYVMGLFLPKLFYAFNAATIKNPIVFLILKLI